MTPSTKPLLALCAEDLMTAEIVRLPEDMTLRGAATLLLQHDIGGAPVVDKAGRCVGVWSARDYLRLACSPAPTDCPAALELPVTCPYQQMALDPDREAVLCTLPAGACPVQGHEEGPDGERRLICREPHCVLTDWQVVQVEKFPTDVVSRHMTPDPVTAAPDASIRELARLMVQTHIHRVVVVDEASHPVGIVSATDILNALAFTDGGEE